MEQELIAERAHQGALHQRLIDAQSSTTKRAFPPKGHGTTVLISERRHMGIPQTISALLGITEQSLKCSNALVLLVAARGRVVAGGSNRQRRGVIASRSGRGYDGNGKRAHAPLRGHVCRGRCWAARRGVRRQQSSRYALHDDRHVADFAACCRARTRVAVV